MKRVLIVEDQPTDVRLAAEVLEELGIKDIEVRTSAAEARMYLESVCERKSPAPEVILLDLDLGYESGYELMRFWYKNPKLAGCRVVVWTVMGKEHAEMCRLFGIEDVVPKWEGVAALKRVLASLTAHAS